MSEISLILVLLKKTNKTLNDMAKVQIKSEKLTPFGGIFSIMEQFDALLAQTIDSTLGLRCTLFGYQYSEILRSLMCVYLCGGSCIEDISTHLMKHLSLHPTLRTCSADTILRAIGELTCKNITYKSASGKSYDFNTADKMNCLLIKALLATGQLKSGQEYDFDFDHQFIETEKYDAKPTYKKFFYDMNNGLGWNRLPKSFMAQNTVFLLMTAFIRNFYKAIMQRLKTHEFGLRSTSRIKTFVFKFISVPAKWIKTSRRYVLNIYSDNYAYDNLFKTDFG